MRFLVFVYSSISPRGGMNDLLVAGNDIRECYRQIKEQLEKLGRWKYDRIDWLDMKTGVVKTYRREFVSEKILKSTTYAVQRT